MQVFQIWIWYAGFSDLEDFWDDLLVSRLEVVWKSSGLLGSLLTKSYGLPGSRMDFQEVVWTSRKSSGLHGSLLTKSPFHNRSERFGKFLCLIFLHLVTSCCIKFLLFFQTKTLQTHSNLFDLKTPNFIWIFQFCLMAFLLIYFFLQVFNQMVLIFSSFKGRSINFRYIFFCVL